MTKVSLWAMALLSVAVTTDAFAQSGNSGSTPGSSRKPSFVTAPTPTANRPVTPSSPPATPPATGTPWTRTGMTQAEWLLAKRLASLDHMRDIAAKNGNERMLDRADTLEALAKRQYDRRTDFSNPHNPATP
jgi:hypothetical protein